MKIKSLTICNYKSIKEPQTIEFEDGKIATIIGVNGSGKSNLLEAIKLFFDMQNKGFYYRTNEQPKYTANLELDKIDLQELEKSLEYNIENNIMKVHFEHNGKTIAKTIQYEPLTKSIAKEQERLLQIRDEFVDVARQYNRLSKSIEFEIATTEYKGYTGHSSNYTQYSGIKDYYAEEIKSKEKQIKEYCQKHIEGDFIKNTICGDYNRIYKYGKHKFDFSIKFNREQFSPFELIFIDFEKMRNAIDKLNNELSEYARQLEQLYDNFITVVNSIADKADIEYEHWDDYRQILDKDIASFQAKIRKSLSKKCVLLDNEKSLLFGSKIQYNRVDDNRNLFNVDNPIERAFSNYCYENKIDIESTNIDIIVDKFEKFIDEFMPQEAKTQYSKIVAEISIEKDNSNHTNIKTGQTTNNVKISNIFVIENDGIKVDINSTSLGRRWMLTYLFAKNNVKKGDILFIDEPAVFLHPTAQIEILKDLQGVAQKGINVIIATHSPYMIVDSIERFYTVNIDEKSGTRICKKAVKEHQVLDYMSFVETQYIVFGMISRDYHNELYGYLQNQIKKMLTKENITVQETDKWITEQKYYKSNTKDYEKITEYSKTKYYAICTAIRNEIAHPSKDGNTFSDDELKNSTNLLRELLKILTI